MSDSTGDIRAIIDGTCLLSDEERIAVYETNARAFLRWDDPVPDGE